MVRFFLAASAAAVALLGPTSALAWGDGGHRVVAMVAQSYMTPTTAAKVDALLRADTDNLTRPDMASRATWADVWRAAGHRETAQWHFVDIELDRPDLKAACFGGPDPSRPASSGPAQDCVIGRILAFRRELADPATPLAEQILALKYLLHFVADLHQPLHASDNHDRGGNCVLLSMDGPRTTNLHSYWDRMLVEELGTDPRALAARLVAQISPAEAARWRKGDPADWAVETYRVSKWAAYWPGAPAGCQPDAAPVRLPAGYEARAKPVAAGQLERAGVRLAAVLNAALDQQAAKRR